MRGNPITWPGAALALASAILFGASTPIAKLLLGDGVSPWLLAGLLYLGSGIGLALVLLVTRALGLGSREAPLRRVDLPWLGLVVLTGGVVGAGAADARVNDHTSLLGLPSAEPGRSCNHADRVGGFSGER